MHALIHGRLGRSSICLFLLAASSEAAAQSATRSPSASAPAVLATVPTPPPGVVPQPGSMSGLPLQVGDLPPGTLAVRVIRGDFSNDVSNQPVELRTSDGRLLRVMTGTDGRALFTGLTVGDEIQAATDVAGTRLESQRFQMPALGGVRVVLVAGVEPAAGTQDVQIESLGPAAAGAPVATRGTIAFIAGLWVAALTAFGVAGRWRRTKAAGTPDHPVVAKAAKDVSASAEYQELARSLVAVERERRSGAMSSEEYQSRRADLMAGLEALCSQPESSASA